MVAAAYGPLPTGTTAVFVSVRVSRIATKLTVNSSSKAETNARLPSGANVTIWGGASGTGMAAVSRLAEVSKRITAPTPGSAM